MNLKKVGFGKSSLKGKFIDPYSGQSRRSMTVWKYGGPEIEEKIAKIKGKIQTEG